MANRPSTTQDDKIKSEEKKSNPLQLFCDNREIDNPSLPIRWCLEKDSLLELSPNYCNLVVILVRDLDNNELSRHIFSFKQGMAFIPLRRPGNTVITAFLLSHISKKRLFSEARNMESGQLKGSSKCYNEITIYVPGEIFAPEPPRWLKWWVELWHRHRSVDQCQFRKRVIWAFTGKPIFSIIWMLFACSLRFIVATALLLIGRLRVSFRPAIHPFAMDMESVSKPAWYEPKHTWIWTKTLWGTKNIGDGCPLWVLAPTYFIFLLWTVAKIIGWIFVPENTVTYHLIHNRALIWSLVSLGIIYLGGGSIVGIGYFFGASDTWNSWSKSRQAKRDAKRKYQLLTSPVSCSFGNLSPTLSSIPLKDRTIRLIFSGIKRHVCRPFRR